ncbi:Cyclin [Parasponia andersonii]|uniref:B-like cyclin n=1 Tax=Parasponia andersonii TaxID=3476 RepID=A0A2P5D0G5_PARAD|nr:Cyclin [Parasponia andersonii]
MSLPQDYTDSDLYCHEEASDVFSQDTNFCDHFDLYSNSDFLPDEESSVVSAFDSERDQVLDSDVIRRFRNDSGFVSARLEAVNWILTVHAYFQFRPETAYRCVNYLDRFLLSTTLPKGKGWPLQLLSVACLSLAAKMEETSVPLLLDLQTKEPKFKFNPQTIQRMELMVMAVLKWRLRLMTPFDFVHHFISKLSSIGFQSECDQNHVVSHTSDIIVQTCQVIDFLDYSPPAIAAAAVICGADRYVDDEIFGCFHHRVRREKVRKCYNLMKYSICLLPHNKRPKLEPEPSPVCMLDAAKIGVKRT